MKGKIFAMVSSKGEFVVKLPAERVIELIGAGVGEFFDPGHAPGTGGFTNNNRGDKT